MYKLFSMLLVLTVVAVTAQAQQYVTDGLVAFWTLDSSGIDGDIVKDVSGNGNDATIMGTLKSVEGVINECLEFDGGENYVEIPPLGAMERASVECWALTSTLLDTPQGIISTFMWEAGKIHLRFQRDVALDKKIVVHKCDGEGVGDKSEFELNTWYHIIYTCDTEANELKLYVNGEFISEGASGDTPQNMDERRIGSEHDGRFLIGMVDEVRIYDRILSAEEVEQNFNVKSNFMAVAPAGKVATTWGKVKVRY